MDPKQYYQDVPENSSRYIILAFGSLSKVSNLGTKPRIDQNVPTLQVAMKNWRARRMQEAKTLHNVANDLQDDFSTNEEGLVAQKVVQ